jgi:aldehyde:ferredoxin oxidoreductase
VCHVPTKNGYYLLKETQLGIDPLSPDNLLIFANSVIAGYPAAGLVRYIVSAKSPLTGGIGETRCEGRWAVSLKQSGYDAIILHGAADAPCGLGIEDGQVSFFEARDLWGKTVGETTDALEAQFADPATYERVNANFERDISTNTLSNWQKKLPGFAVWVHLVGLDAALTTENFRTASFKGVDAYKGEAWLPMYRGVAPCPGCPNDCMKIYHAGDDLDPRAGAMHQEITGTLGSNIGTSDIKALMRFNNLCNQWGLDPVSLGFTLSRCAITKSSIRSGRGRMPWGTASSPSRRPAP